MKVSSIVKTPMVRKAVSAAMLAAATLGVTNSMAKPNKIQEPVQTQTELMSPETALAVQAQSGKNYLPTAHNRQLDEKLLAIDPEYASQINTLYSEIGTYGATAFFSIALSYELMDKVLADVEKMYTSVEKLKAKGEDNEYIYVSRAEFDKKMKSLRQAKEQLLYGLITDTNKLSDSRQPLEKYFEFIDNLVATAIPDYKSSYEYNVANFKAQQKTQGVQRNADLLAYKFHLGLGYFYKVIATNHGIVDKVYQSGRPGGVFSSSSRQYFFHAFETHYNKKGTPTP